MLGCLARPDVIATLRVGDPGPRPRTVHDQLAVVQARRTTDHLSGSRNRQRHHTDWAEPTMLVEITILEAREKDEALLARCTVSLPGFSGLTCPASFGPTYPTGSREPKPAPSWTFRFPRRFGSDHKWGQMCPDRWGPDSVAKTPRSLGRVGYLRR